MIVLNILLHAILNILDGEILSLNDGTAFIVEHAKKRLVKIRNGSIADLNDKAISVVCLDMLDYDVVDRRPELVN